MVIHTIIDEYDLLYAQQREAAYAVAEMPRAECKTTLSAEQTRLPELANQYEINRTGEVMQ